MKKVFTEDLSAVGMRRFTPDNGEWQKGVPCEVSVKRDIAKARFT